VADEPFHNPFGALRSLKTPPSGRADDAPASAPPPGPSAASPSKPSQPSAARPIARAVVRFERAGRGGKQVTVVEQLGLPAMELSAWLKALKAELGCGGLVESGALVLQGDHRKRLPAILTARGVKKITVG
jgi:translation initiation factor 1